MKYAVVHTFGNFIHEGSKAECEIVLKAFSAYGIGEFKFDIIEIPTPKLSDDTYNEVTTYLSDVIAEIWDGDDTYSAIADGVEGLSEMSHESLVEMLSQYVDLNDSEASNTQIYIKAASELGIEQLLIQEDPMGDGDEPKVWP